MKKTVENPKESGKKLSVDSVKVAHTVLMQGAMRGLPQDF